MNSQKRSATTRRQTLVAAAAAARLALPVSVAVAQAPAPFGVLVVTATAGFRHDSIPAAVAAIRRIGERTGAFFTTVLPEVADLATLDAGLLAQHRVVCFASTSGELPLTGEQQAAIVDFVRAGGGFVGTHSAADTGYTWPAYGELVGAYFLEHPWTQTVRVQVDDAAHPTTAGLPASFEIEEEIYVFRSDPRQRPDTRVVLSLDASSVGAVGAAGTSGEFPLSWCAPFGAGRSFYTALGHFDAVWEDPWFGAHLANGIAWAAGA